MMRKRKPKELIEKLRDGGLVVAVILILLVIMAILVVAGYHLGPDRVWKAPRPPGQEQVPPQRGP
jgi:hypothetical protein